MEFGPLQDGGVAANNPTEAGGWELKVIWPATGTPAVVVSIGTGFSNEPESPIPATLHGMWGLLTDGYIMRLFRSLIFSRSMHGQNSYATVINNLEEHVRGNYFRMNLSLETKEPALDDADKIPELRRQVRSQLTYQNDCTAIARALWASRFYFKLDDIPKYHLGTYQCRGSILCQSTCPPALIRHIKIKFPNARFMFNSESVLGNLALEPCCSGCGHFSKLITFDIRHKDESIQLFSSTINSSVAILTDFPILSLGLNGSRKWIAHSER